MNNNTWDQLSTYFDTTKKAGLIPAGAADNILIAWPVITSFINKYLPSRKNEKALEYGCGTGGFANKLFQLGFSVTGIDTSRKMVKIAKKSYGKNIEFYTGDSSLLDKMAPFNIITSIMTLQFIEDVEKTIFEFSKALLQNGLLVFAVHNPDYMKGEVLTFDNGIKIPIYISTSSEYSKLAAKYGFKHLIEKYPPFTQEFITKYPEYSNIKDPEYLILGYKKIF